MNQLLLIIFFISLSVILTLDSSNFNIYVDVQTTSKKNYGTATNPFLNFDLALNHVITEILEKPGQLAQYNEISVILNPGEYIIQWSDKKILDILSQNVSLAITGSESMMCEEEKKFCTTSAILKFHHCRNGLRIQYSQNITSTIKFANLGIKLIEVTEIDSPLFDIKAPMGSITMENITITDITRGINSNNPCFNFQAQQIFLKNVIMNNTQILNSVFNIVSLNDTKTKVHVENFQFIGATWINHQAAFLKVKDIDEISLTKGLIKNNHGIGKIFDIQDSKSLLISEMAIYDSISNEILTLYNIEKINITNIVYENEYDSYPEKTSHPQDNANSLATIRNFNELTINQMNISNIKVIDQALISIEYNNSNSNKNSDNKLFVESGKIVLKNSRFHNNQIGVDNIEKLRLNAVGIITMTIDQGNRQGSNISNNDYNDIIIENVEFINNIIFNPKLNNSLPTICTTTSSSTLSITAIDSKLFVNNVNMKNNSVPRGFNNFYIHTKTFIYNESKYYSNLMSEWDLPLNLSNQSIIKGCNIFMNLNINSAYTLIQYSKFIGNYADLGGAIRFLNNSITNGSLSSFALLHNEFSFNYAYKGGAFYSNYQYFNQTVLTISHNTFTNNDGFISSPHIHLSFGYDKIVKEYNNTFIWKQLKPILFVSYPNMNLTENKSITQKFESNTFDVKNITIGEKLPFEMTFAIYDKNYEIIVCPYCFNVYFYIQTLEAQKNWANYSFLSEMNNLNGSVSDEKIVMNEPILYAPPLTNNALNVSFVKRVPYPKLNQIQSFVLHFETNNITPNDYIFCSFGEYYDEIKKACTSCPTGSYSLSENISSCIPCPINVECSGGTDFRIHSGFWRNPDNLTGEIIYCKMNPLACLGGFNSTCQKGYTGPVCSICSDDYSILASNNANDKLMKYTKVSRSTCVSCDMSNILYIISKIIMGFLFSYGILRIVLSYDNIMNLSNENSKDRSQLILLVNIMIHYLNLLYVMQGLNVVLPQLLSSLLDIIITPTYQIWGLIQCFINSPGFEVPFVYILYYVIIIIIRDVILAFSIFKKSLFSFNKTTLLSIFLTILSLDLISILDFLFSYMDCMEIDGNSRPRINMQSECKGVKYDMIINYIITPLIILCGLIMPVIIMKTFTKPSSSISNAASNDNMYHRQKVYMIGHVDDDNYNLRRLSVYLEISSPLLLLILNTMMKAYDSKVLAYLIIFGLLLGCSLNKRIEYYADFRKYLLLIQKFILILSLTDGLCDNNKSECTSNSSYDLGIYAIIWIMNLIYLMILLISILEIIQQKPIVKLLLVLWMRLFKKKKQTKYDIGDNKNNENDNQRNQSLDEDNEMVTLRSINSQATDEQQPSKEPTSREIRQICIHKRILIQNSVNIEKSNYLKEIKNDEDEVLWMINITSSYELQMHSYKSVNYMFSYKQDRH